MLNLKIVLLDSSELAYGINSIYTQALNRSQLELLYLATALSLRPNQVTVLNHRSTPVQEQGIHFLPLADYDWSQSEADLVIFTDTLENAPEVRAQLPERCKMVLWSHLPPEHIAMLGLQNEAIKALLQGFVFETALLSRLYQAKFGLPVENCFYRWPCMTRSLRRRITESNELLNLRNSHLTLAFTARPDQGLEQVLDMFEVLQAGFSALELLVLLPPAYAELSATGSLAAVERARSTPQVQVIEPAPWPSQVEHLFKAHVLCHPLAFTDLGCAQLIDPLATGCKAVLPDHPSLREVAREWAEWVSPEPSEDYLQRYTQAVAKVLQACQQDAETALKQAFRQVAGMGTYYTWDLRVWEWESLLYLWTQPLEGAQV